MGPRQRNPTRRPYAGQWACNQSQSPLPRGAGDRSRRETPWGEHNLGPASRKSPRPLTYEINEMEVSCVWVHAALLSASRHLPENAPTVLEVIEEDGGGEGLLLHFAHPTDRGFDLTEIWESKEYLDAFNRTVIPKAMSRADLPVAGPEPELSEFTPVVVMTPCAFRLGHRELRTRWFGPATEKFRRSIPMSDVPRIPETVNRVDKWRLLPALCGTLSIR